jgi:amidase
MTQTLSKTSERGETTADIALQLDNVDAGYGLVPVLNALSLTLREGEIVGVLGHNGMGKTTLLRVLMGELRAKAGLVEIGGHDVRDLPTHARAHGGIGYVPQGRGILPGLSAEDNLRLAYLGGGDEVDGETEDEALARVLGLLPRVQAMLARKGGNLSGGEQQILALARALMIRPWLLLLDEPTEGIQPSIIEEMAATLAQLRDATGLTILVTEQNLDFLLDCANRLLVIERGQIVDELNSAAMHDPARMAVLANLGAARATRGQEMRTPTTPRQKNSNLIANNCLLPGGNRQFNSLLNTESHFNNPKEIPTMTIKRPTVSQLTALVESLHMSMSEHEVQDYLSLMENSFQAYDRVDALPDFLPEVKYPRTPGYRPSAADNPMNAWYVKSEVRGATSGPLAGKRIVLKDNMCLAGVPMMNGASTLEGYVPDIDATVVTRILDAGGTIVGKAHCEYFCLSGGSHTSAAGPVHNPYRHGYIAGGSSSGCGALVGAGEVEMAIGCDQGGSIRIPSAFSGAYGMKPTHGLVPYTGIMPIESTIDHAGPITTTVADNALLLEVIAGADGLDPRQYAPRIDRYTAALGRGVRGLRIGVVTQGFAHANSEREVDGKVRLAAERLQSLGAIVEEVSIPMHLDGAAIWTPIALEGLQAQMMHGNSMGFNWKGLYTTSLLDRHANWRTRANELSPSLKVSMFVGEYFLRHYGGRFYAKAQNLSRLLTAAYDLELQRFDLLLMPTLPITAQPIPAPGAPITEVIGRAFDMVANTAPFDATGHPAMSVPCGLVQGLPVGMMLIGKHYAESTLYQAAHAFEQMGDWRTF